MQIDDILKAAIQDAGLEFFNATTAYSSPANSINSSESSLNQFSLDDDFTLTDLDWNLLDQSEESPVASTSISPASQCSVQSPYNPIQSNTTTPVQVAQAQPQPAEIPCTTIAEDTDPFILALQELDEHNSKLDNQAYSNFDDNNNNINNNNVNNKTNDLNNNEINYKNNNISDPKRLTVEPSLTHLIKPIARPITQLASKSKADLLSKPQTKIVSFNQSMMKPQVCQVVAKSSDLTSLINYRATSVINKPTNKVFEIFKFNRGWKTRTWRISHR